MRHKFCFANSQKRPNLPYVKTKLDINVRSQPFITGYYV